MIDEPPATVLGQGGIGGGGELHPQRRLLISANQPGAAGAGLGQARASAGTLPQPPANRGGIVLEERGDVSHTMTAIHCGQGSFTDVIGGVRALHTVSVPDRHIH